MPVTVIIGNRVSTGEHGWGDRGERGSGLEEVNDRYWFGRGHQSPQLLEKHDRLIIGQRPEESEREKQGDTRGGGVRACVTSVWVHNSRGDKKRS
ncbi:hypothetical protein J6590_012283 [Homalodisca vitripennis]|nr:hypothetical protein J6590_012283 [Homalodisca vitripennis]